MHLSLITHYHVCKKKKLPYKKKNSLYYDKSWKEISVHSNFSQFLWEPKLDFWPLAYKYFITFHTLVFVHCFMLALIFVVTSHIYALNIKPVLVLTINISCCFVLTTFTIFWFMPVYNWIFRYALVYVTNILQK